MKYAWLIAASLFLVAPLVAQEPMTAEAYMVKLIQERDAVVEAQKQAYVAWVATGKVVKARNVDVEVYSRPSFFSNAPTVRSHTRIQHNPGGSVTGFTTTTVYPNLVTKHPTWPVTTYSTFTVTAR